MDHGSSASLHQHLNTEPPTYLPTSWLACSNLLFPCNQKHPSEIRICTIFPLAGAHHWLLLTLGWDLNSWPMAPKGLGHPAIGLTSCLIQHCPLLRFVPQPFQVTFCALDQLSSYWNFSCSFLRSLLLAMANHFAGPISSFLPLSMCLQWAPCEQSSQLWSWPEDLLWPIACGSVGCFSGRCGREESISDQGPYLVEVRISGCAREHSFYNRVKRDEVHFFSIEVTFQKLFFLMFSLFCPQATNVHKPTEWKSLYSKLIWSKYRPGITVCPGMNWGPPALSLVLGKNISRFSWECIWKYNRILLPKSGIQVLACQLPMLSSRPAQYILRAYFHIGKREQIPSSRITLRIKWMNMQWIQTFGKP